MHGIQLKRKYIMTKEELAEKITGENLDSIMNIDPRGYGVSRILYKASRKYADNKSTSMTFAKKICSIFSNAEFEKLSSENKKSNTVLIMTGFVLRPHLMPETDGIVGALLFARSLIYAFGITPILSVNEKNIPAILSTAALMGLHVYDNIETAKKMPLSFSFITIPVEKEKAAEKIKEFTSRENPLFVFSTECAGANSSGEYHNATGINMTELESKQDLLFEFYKKKKVPAFAVGDLGNEIGMGKLSSHIKKFIPYADGTKNGITAFTSADFVLTATVSDWGVYAVIAAIAFLKKDISIMHDEKMEEAVLRQCCLSGMVDMTGSLLPAIDGFNVEFQKQIVALMRSTVDFAINYDNKTWFEKVLEKKFYDTQ